MLERFGKSLTAIGLVIATATGCGGDKGHLGGENPINCNEGPYSITEEYSLPKGETLVVGVIGAASINDFRNTIESEGNGAFTIIAETGGKENKKIEILIEPYRGQLTDEKKIIEINGTKGGVITIYSNQLVSFPSKNSNFSILGSPLENGNTLLTVTEECLK